MALISCNECGNQVSNRAHSCPQCGFPLREMAETSSAPSPELRQEGAEPVRKRRHRPLVIIGFVLVFVAGPFAPRFALGAGVLVILLCVASLIPTVSSLPRKFLRIETGSAWRTMRRLAAYGLAGSLLALVGMGALVQEGAREKEAEEVAAANSTVQTLVQDAQSAWREGDIESAISALDRAVKTPKATSLSSARSLRTEIADSVARALLEKARNLISEDQLDRASAELTAALEVPQVSTSVTEEVRALENHIRLTTDLDAITSALLASPDDQFEAFVTGEQLPDSISTGVEALDARIVALALENKGDIADSRSRMKQELAEKERRAAEAAAEAAAAREAREEAAAEARKAREKVEAEARRKKNREEQIAKQFSAWDGSHRGLTKVIKESMNDPDSYDHVDTVYWDRGSYLDVKTTFRGKNVCGGVVKNWVKAKVDLKGNVLSVTEQGP